VDHACVLDADVEIPIYAVVSDGLDTLVHADCPYNGVEEVPLGDDGRGGGRVGEVELVLMLIRSGSNVNEGSV